MRWQVLLGGLVLIGAETAPAQTRDIQPQPPVETVVEFRNITISVPAGSAR